MVYQEKINKKTKEYEYYCEDVFAEVWIYSKIKLSGETLDEIVLDNVLAKKILKGHTDKIRFIAKAKPQWEDDDEEEVEIETPKKKGWFKKILDKIKMVKKLYGKRVNKN